jgi:hypothetical protein
MRTVCQVAAAINGGAILLNRASPFRSKNASRGAAENAETENRIVRNWTSIRDANGSIQFCVVSLFLFRTIFFCLRVLRGSA